MVLNICNFKQRTEQVPVELDISAIEEYILLLLLYVDAKQLAISELVEYPSIDSAILVVLPLILEISFQNDFCSNLGKKQPLSVYASHFDASLQIYVVYDTHV